MKYFNLHVTLFLSSPRLCTGRNNAPFISFQGLLVSSGPTNDHEDMVGMFESWWHRTTASSPTRPWTAGSRSARGPPSCTPRRSARRSGTFLAEQGHINPYTIYTPTCDKESPYQRRFWTPRGRAVSCHEHFNQQQSMILFYIQ